MPLFIKLYDTDVFAVVRVFYFRLYVVGVIANDGLPVYTCLSGFNAALRLSRENTTMIRTMNRTGSDERHFDVPAGPFNREEY